MILVDSSVWIEYFRGTISPETNLLDSLLGSEPVAAGDLILAEVAYVLESFYEVARPGVAAVLRSILAFPAIRVVDADLLQRAVEVYEVERLDFADAYLVACAERTGVGAIVSFARTIDRVGTVRRIEPAA